MNEVSLPAQEDAVPRVPRAVVPASDETDRDDRLARITVPLDTHIHRYNALVELHKFFEALQGAPPGTLGMTDVEWEEYATMVEATSNVNVDVNDAVYADAVKKLHDAIFWTQVVLIALPNVDSQRYFVEQLVRHRYLRHRVFLPTDVDEWVPCDVQQAASTIWAPRGVRLLLHAARPSLQLMGDLTIPFSLSFADLYAYLDAPFAMRREVSTTADDDLAIVNDYDPAYIPLLLTPLSPEVAAGKAALYAVYVPPLLIHESLLHNQPISVPASEPSLRSALAYLGKLLPTASAAYRAWHADDDPANAAFLLRRVYEFLHLAY